MNPQTLGLVMIVRNEADNLPRCLTAAIPHISHWTIVDTGSTDGTQDIARELLAGIPGTLHEMKWAGFGPCRTAAMRHASGTADYLLLLDADMVVRVPDPLPRLTLDCYQGRILDSSIDYTLPFLVRGDRPWTYEGAAHSYLALAGGYTEEELPGLGVEDYSVVTEEKLRGDVELLSAALARDPLDTRTAFYLAQSYSDLDMIPEAIAMYRYRANLTGGFDEETFLARHRLGTMLCDYVSFAQGARELLAAWEMRPGRIESLRALANSANAVADKTPYPTGDALFVDKRHYKTRQLTPPQLAVAAAPVGVPTLVAAARPKRLRLTKMRRLRPSDVTAILVTRGNVDLGSTLDALPYDDVVVWNNSVEADYKVFGRYAAVERAKNPVLFWVDDDVVFRAHDELLAAYQPGVLVANMDQPWIDGAGYRDGPALVGAGSLCDHDLPAKVFSRYLAEYPFDDDLLLECDFVFGTLAPWVRVDLGYEVRDFADDADRLYQQPGQTERKWRMINRARRMLAKEAA